MSYSLLLVTTWIWSPHTCCSLQTSNWSNFASLEFTTTCSSNNLVILMSLAVRQRLYLGLYWFGKSVVDLHKSILTKQTTIARSSSCAFSGQNNTQGTHWFFFIFFFIKSLTLLRQFIKRKVRPRPKWS